MRPLWACCPHLLPPPHVPGHSAGRGHLPRSRDWAKAGAQGPGWGVAALGGTRALHLPCWGTLPPGLHLSTYTLRVGECSPRLPSSWESEAQIGWGSQRTGGAHQWVASHWLGLEAPRAHPGPRASPTSALAASLEPRVPVWQRFLLIRRPGTHCTGPHPRATWADRLGGVKNRARAAQESQGHPGGATGLPGRAGVLGCPYLWPVQHLDVPQPGPLHTLLVTALPAAPSFWNGLSPNLLTQSPSRSHWLDPQTVSQAWLLTSCTWQAIRVSYLDPSTASPWVSPLPLHSCHQQRVLSKVHHSSPFQGLFVFIELNVNSSPWALRVDTVWLSLLHQTTHPQLMLSSGP